VRNVKLSFTWEQGPAEGERRAFADHVADCGADLPPLSLALAFQ